MDSQRELHVVEEGIAGSGQTLVVTVESHLFMELACCLGRAVREDFQKIWMESAGNKEGFAQVAAVDGPSCKGPTGKSIFLQGLVAVFLGTKGSRARESGWRGSQR